MGWLGDTRIIPVLVLNDAGKARPVAEALLEGGMRVAEVTLRTGAAIESIRSMAELKDLVVGAGTVVSAKQVDLAVDAGAQFIVSPGLSEQVTKRARRHGVPVLPGVVTPSEIMRAGDLGLNLLKFFPAEASGGVAMLKALAGPFREAQFVPTGGVGLHNVLDYLALDCVPAVGGSWMVDPTCIAQGDYASLRYACAQAVGTVRP